MAMNEMERSEAGEGKSEVRAQLRLDKSDRIDVSIRGGFTAPRGSGWGEGGGG